jgi:hypothetical protein
LRNSLQPTASTGESCLYGSMLSLHKAALENFHAGPAKGLAQYATVAAGPIASGLSGGCTYYERRDSEEVVMKLPKQAKPVMRKGSKEKIESGVGPSISLEIRCDSIFDCGFKVSI